MSNPACAVCNMRVECLERDFKPSCPAGFNGTRIRVRLNFSDQPDWVYDDAIVLRAFHHAGNDWFLIACKNYGIQKIPMQQVEGRLK